MIRVVSAMCCKVKGNRKSLLACSKVPPVEGVRLFSGGESGILPDGPRPHGVHGRIGSAEIGWYTGSIVQVLHALQIFTGINALQDYSLRRLPLRADTVFFLPLLFVS